MNSPKVSIIMLNWNGLKDAVECLESLRKIIFSNYQVIVVDNGSQGNDVETIKDRFGVYVHVIENDSNCGFAEGNNIGMRYALANLDPDYLLLVNNDITVAPDFLSELVKAAENDHEIGLLGPLVYDYYKPNVIRGTGSGQTISWWRGVTVGIMSSISSEESTGIRDADSIEGSCMLVRTEVLNKVGMLDRQYFNSWEETDWCVRIRKAGYKVCCVTSSKIWHKVQPSYINSFRLYYFVRNNIQFMRKNAEKKYLITFFPYFTFISLPMWCFKPFLANPVGTVSTVTKALLWNISHRPAKNQ